MANLMRTKVTDADTGEEGFLDKREDVLWLYDEQCYSVRQSFQGRFLKKGGGKAKGKGKKGKTKGGRWSTVLADKKKKA